MMASSKDKAIALKDSYVDTLVKGGVTEPVQRMPETDQGEVAIDPVTIGIGAAVAGSAAGLWHLPEMHETMTGLTGAVFNTENARNTRSKGKT